jgi:hypothetical protein
MAKATKITSIALALATFTAGAAEAAAKRPSALTASYHGTLLDGPLTGQIAGAGAVPEGATRRIQTPYGVVTCSGGNNRVNKETGHGPSGSSNRQCNYN